MSPKYYYLNRFGEKIQIELHYRGMMPRFIIAKEVLSDNIIQIHATALIEEPQNDTAKLQSAIDNPT